MVRPVPPSPSRRLAALALLLLPGSPLAPGARAQAGQDRPAATKPAPRPSGSAAAAHAHPVDPGKPTQAAKPEPLVVPPAPPPAPVLPAPIVVPTRQPPPPQPVPVTPDAPGQASKSDGGLLVTFGPGRADLNPDSNTAITALAHAAPGPEASFTITAYAAGGDDPSVPRRLSLSRALAVRGALMQAGIASVRIYVKALGASAPSIAEGPPDRVDIVVTAAPGPATQTGTVPTPAPPPPASPPVAPAAPWGARPTTTQTGQPPTAPVPTQKADP